MKQLLTKTRLENLSDAVFAIAMTLLVLNINVPVMTDAQANEKLITELAKLWPHFFAFALSVFVLANLWMVHHRHFHYIEKVNTTFIWLSILMLALIVLVPFSASLIGEYQTTTAAAVFFGANLFGIGIAILGYWLYASRNRRLVAADLDDETIAYETRRSMALPVVSLIAIPVAFVSPDASRLTYLILPVLMRTLLREKE